MASEDNVFFFDDTDESFVDVDEFLDDMDELFGTSHATEHNDTLLRAVANVRRRVAEGDTLYNPLSAMAEEYDKCSYLSGDTWEKILAPRSWLGIISVKRYNELINDSKALSVLWDQELKKKSRVWAERLLGTIAMSEDLLCAYELCEELTHKEREGPYSLSLREEPASMDALETLRLFERYAGYRPFHYNPFYVRPGELPQDKEVDESADLLSQNVWRYRASCSSAQLLGRLLLEDDYGLAHARELVSCC